MFMIGIKNTLNWSFSVQGGISFHRYAQMHNYECPNHELLDKTQQYFAIVGVSYCLGASKTRILPNNKKQFW